MAKRFPDLVNAEARELEQMRYFEWLPVMENDSFELPGNVYLNSVAKLVGRKGKILRFTREREITGEFRDCIGIKARPSLQVVIENLIDHQQRGEEPDTFIYRELNTNVNALSENQRRTLFEKPLLYIDGEAKFVPGAKVYWKSHPFGSYRFTLPDKYREFQRLMQEVMGVKDEPSPDDYLDILAGIAEQDCFHTMYDGAERTFVESIYAYLSYYIGTLEEEPRISTELNWQERFKKSRVILCSSGQLKQASHVFFADKDWAIRVFRDRIEDLLVGKNPATWPFLNALGVRPLSSAVKVEYFSEPELTRPSPVEKVLKVSSRQKAFQRITETYRQTSPLQEWRILTLQNLEITECEDLQVEFSIEISGSKILSGLKNPFSHYDEKTSTLYILNSLPDEVGLLEIARRIAGILNPKVDPSTLCPQIRYVIDPRLEDNQVHHYLTCIGIDELVDKTQTAPSYFGDKKAIEESLIDHLSGDETEEASEQETKQANRQPKGQASPSSNKPSTTSPVDANPEDVVDRRREYFRKRREYYESRDSFESKDRWSEERQEERRSLTPEEREEHVYNVKVFYNRQIRNIERQLNRLEYGDEVFDFYSSEWDTISMEIRERDGNQCRRCGISANDLKDFGSHLTVHHIFPRKEGGSNWPSNLINLCVPCHREVEGYPELL